MLLRLFTILFAILALAACNKPDPNPELKDPIYNDLNALLGASNQALETEKKTLEGHEQALKEVVPQTGQIKYAQKRVYESQQKISKIQQEIQYLELKIEARKKASKKSYLEAFKKGETWPDPKEWQSYETSKRLRAAKTSWDSRDRIKEFSGALEQKTPAASEGSHH